MLTQSKGDSLNRDEHLRDTLQGYQPAPGHDEELADHAGALADVLLHQLRAGHADEGAVGVVRHCARQQRLPRARRPVQQHTLRRHAVRDKSDMCMSSLLHLSRPGGRFCHATRRAHQAWQDQVPCNSEQRQGHRPVCNARQKLIPFSWVAVCKPVSAVAANTVAKSCSA